MKYMWEKGTLTKAGQPGRGGNGAILGSKQVKAITVRGAKAVPIHDLETYHNLGKQIAQARATSPVVAGFRADGSMPLAMTVPRGYPQ